MANGLRELDFNVSVVTPLPNYPTGEIFEQYKGKFSFNVIENGINVHRLWIFASNSKSKIHRFFAMISYSLSLLWFFAFNKIPKTVIVQSPPLLVAFTCMLFLKSSKRKLILNVSDLWPSAGLELGVFKENYSYNMLKCIEKFNYKRANLVLGQSQEILNHVASTVHDKELLLYRNYPDFLPPEITRQENISGKIKLVYAGLLGVAQGILKLCENLDYSHIEFHIYGSGAAEEQILDFIESNSHLPIVFHGRVTRDTLHKELLGYDIAIIPLLNRIYGSVPSKIFEYAQLGLPMIYCGGGEGEYLIRNNNLGWVVEVGNYQELNSLLKVINRGDLGQGLRNKIRQEAMESFNFSKQLDELKKKL